jgi:hypothetical protein
MNYVMGGGVFLLEGLSDWEGTHPRATENPAYWAKPSASAALG